MPAISQAIAVDDGHLPYATADAILRQAGTLHCRN